MTAAAFDTHACFKRLTAAGMPEAQAEVLLDALAQRNHHLAIKKDFELFESRMTIKVGVMLVAAVGIVVAAMRLMLD